MTETKKKKQAANKPPVNNHKMEDLAAAVDMSIEDFFRSEVMKHGSVYAAAKFHNMRPSAWAYWKKELGIEIAVKREVIISPKD